MEQVLIYAGLVEEWLPVLETYGVATPSDLLFLQCPSLVAMGIPFTQARSLLSVAYSVHACGGVDQYAEVVAAAGDAENEAMDKLDVLLAALEDEGAVSNCLVHAHKLLQDSPGARGAVLAATAVERALSSGQDAGLRKALAPAVHAVMDVVVWRIQLSVPFGNRDLFLSELEMACAGSQDVHFASRVLLSHYKAVATRFPSAFLSQTKTHALRSGRGCRARRANKSTPEEAPVPLSFEV